MSVLAALARKKAATVPLSTQQAAFVSAVEALPPGGALALRAKAGTGKTFALVRAAGALVKAGVAPSSIALLAFNAKIREELTGRAPTGCVVHTFHSFAGSVLGTLNPDVGKVHKITKDTGRDGVQNPRARWPIAQAVSLAKNLSVGHMLPDDEDTWTGILTDFDIRLPRGVTLEYVRAHARRVFALSNRMTTYDFDDMLYRFPTRATAPQYEYVFVDEAQDTNLAQVAILDALVANGRTRLIVIGDPAQAIYGWRGAGVDAFELLVERYSATSLDLTQTRRCPQAVVREAQRIVPGIEALADAPEGAVENTPLAGFRFEDLKPGDAVLCRNNAPLLQGALQCIERDIPAAILGRDMKGAITYQMGAALKGKRPDQGEQGFEQLTQKVQADMHDRPFALQTALDEIDCAYAVWRYMNRKGLLPRTLDELTIEVERICGRLFADESRGNNILFSSVHRAKGLEWGTVYILAPEKIPSRAAMKKGGWHLDQELNLLYVAITRAKQRLVYVSNSTDPVKRALFLHAQGAQGGSDATGTTAAESTEGAGADASYGSDYSITPTGDDTFMGRSMYLMTASPEEVMMEQLGIEARKFPCGAHDDFLGGP